MRLLAGLPVGGGERDFEGVAGRERNGTRESRLGSQTASCVSSCEDRLVVNGKAYLSFTLPPTPAPLPWTVNVASSKLQPAARTAELKEMAAKAALRRSFMVCVIVRDARKQSESDLTRYAKARAARASGGLLNSSWACWLAGHLTWAGSFRAALMGGENKVDLRSSAESA
ncbi:hypothetical protein KC360_g61 [Hortaea werneckii]|nr:hypothetical protein KC344_g59 [Hortaea werneckii]KAI7180367.1 hypothetical protein KC360_g61 [Hortaea werneckii]